MALLRPPVGRALLHARALTHKIPSIAFPPAHALCRRFVQTRLPAWSAGAESVVAANGSRAPVAAAAPKHVAHKVFKFDIKGNYECTEFTKSMAAQMRLQPRDLRALELYHSQCAVYPRRDTILINFLYIKAIITHQACIVYDPDNVNIKEYVDSIANRVKTEADAEGYHPYEFRVLEAILDVVSTELKNDLDQLRPNVLTVLNLLEETQIPTFDRRILKHLLMESKRLTRFEQRAREMQTVLQDILDSDADMAQMYLTTKAQTGHPRRMDMHDEVEMIFENCLKQVDEIVRDAAQLKSFIKDTEDVININLDSQRNEMMRLELQLSMGTFSVSMCGLVAAFFGMNLTSQLEETPAAFYMVCAGVVFSSAAVFTMLKRYGAWKRMW